MLCLEKKDLVLEKIHRWGFGEGALKYKDARVHCQSLRHSEHHDRLSGKIFPLTFRACVCSVIRVRCVVCARAYDACVCACAYDVCVFVCARMTGLYICQHLSAFFLNESIGFTHIVTSCNISQWKGVVTFAKGGTTERQG